MMGETGSGTSADCRLANCYHYQPHSCDFNGYCKFHLAILYGLCERQRSYTTQCSNWPPRTHTSQIERKGGGCPTICAPGIGGATVEGPIRGLSTQHSPVAMYIVPARQSIRRCSNRCGHVAAFYTCFDLPKTNHAEKMGPSTHDQCMYCREQSHNGKPFHSW